VRKKIWGSTSPNDDDITNREKAVSRLDVFSELDVVEGALEERLVVVDVDDGHLHDGRRAFRWVALLIQEDDWLFRNLRDIFISPLSHTSHLLLCFASRDGAAKIFLC